MSDAVRKILLLPRFTSFAGPGPFYTAPMNIRAYAKAFITGWRSRGIGMTPSVAGITVEESTDLTIWSENPDVINPAENAEATAEVSFSFEWMRLRIDLFGGPCGNTLWAVGNFVEREQ